MGAGMMSLEMWDRTEQTEASSWCLLENRTLDGYYVFFMNLRFSYLIFSFCFVCWNLQFVLRMTRALAVTPRQGKKTYFWCPFKLLQSHECTRFLVEDFVLHYFIGTIFFIEMWPKTWWFHGFSSALKTVSLTEWTIFWLVRSFHQVEITSAYF